MWKRAGTLANCDRPVRVASGDTVGSDRPGQTTAISIVKILFGSSSLAVEITLREIYRRIRPIYVVDANGSAGRHAHCIVRFLLRLRAVIEHPGKPWTGLKFLADHNGHQLRLTPCSPQSPARTSCKRAMISSRGETVRSTIPIWRVICGSPNGNRCHMSLNRHSCLGLV